MLLTLMVAIAATIVVANIEGFGWPLVGGDRASIAALCLLGGVVYRLSPAGDEPSDAITTGLGVLGGGAFFLVAADIFVGTDLVLVLLLTTLALVWLVLTLRHLRQRG